MAKLGQAFIDFFVRGKEKVRADTQQVSEDINQVETKSAKAGAGVKESFDKATKGPEALASGFGKLLGVVGAVTALIRTAIIVVDYFKTRYEDGAKAAERFAASLTFDPNDAMTSIKAVQDRLIEVNSELAWATEHPISAALGAGRSVSTIKEEKAALLDLNKAIGAQERAKKAREKDAEREAEKAAEISSLEGLEREKQAIIASGLEGEAKIKADTLITLNALNKRLMLDVSEAEKEAILEIMQLRRDQMESAIYALRDAEHEKEMERIKKENAERIKGVQDEFLERTRQANSQASGFRPEDQVFGNNIAGGLSAREWAARAARI